MPSPRLAPLRHPGWWCALAVLVLNDHVLKHAMPSALTGKLSDVAGLIVAPVLVAALFGARSRTGRALAFAACALPFAAINLSPALAAHWDALVGWSTTTDPTDLFTLLVAPVALHIAAYEPAPSRELVPRFGAVLGALACIATSPVEPITATRGGPLLENQLSEEVTVRVRWIDAAIDCVRLGEWMSNGDDEALGRALDPALFDIARTYRLASAESADLTRPAEEDDLGWRQCDALIVGADGLEPQLIAYFNNEWAAHTLTLVPTAGEELRLTTSGSNFLRTRPTPSVDPASCEPTEHAGVFSWTGAVPTFAVVQGYEPLSEGCFILSLSDQFDTSVEAGERTDDPTDPPRLEPIPGETHPLTICAPREHFAFAVGDQITTGVGPNELSLTGEHHTVRLERLDALYADASAPLCEGARLPCGAYVEPVGWGALVPGQVDIDEGSDLTITRLLDDAIHVVAAHADCGLEPGLRGVLLTHWENHE